MRTQKKNQGFTLVEIMIVVAIIALLAAIAIPNLLRARLTSNDSLAKATLRAMSTAAESYGTANNGQYPTTMAELTTATPPYLNQDYVANSVGNGISGYVYTDTLAATGYTFTATPANANSGSYTTIQVNTGGVLTCTGGSLGAGVTGPC